MQRIDWIDNLRGFSIIAIVFLHCTIAVNQHAGHFTASAEWLNSVLQPVRLGLMFFVSGLFVDSGLKKGRARFYRNKVQSILYPFFIWMVIYGGLKWMFNSLSNHPQTPMAILLTHLSGGGDVTWFLHSLFLFFLAIIWLRNLAFYLVIPACILASWLLPAIPDAAFSGFDASHLNKSFYLFIFFYLGDYLVKKRINIVACCQRRALVAFSLCAFIVLSSLNLNTTHIPYSLLAPLAVMAIPLFIYAATKIQSRAIKYVGEHSIVFYLTHYLVIQAVAKMKIREDIDWINDGRFLLAFAAALALPLAVCLLRQRGWLNGLFTLKSPEKTVPAYKKGAG